LERLENVISSIKYLIEVSNKETDECEMITEKSAIYNSTKESVLRMEKAICILKDKCFYGIMKQYSII
jgi:hypothetical protein